MPLLTNDLESGDGILSLIAAGALGQHGIFKGLRTVEVALKDKDRDVRIQAVEALSQIVDERSTAMLESMLADSDDIVRIKAAGAVIKRLLR